jgi:hypothetical protein
MNLCSIQADRQYALHKQFRGHSENIFSQSNAKIY